MTDVLKFFHIAAAILWLGGMGFVLYVLRPSALMLQPAVRLPLMVAVLSRFFVVVWTVIAVLLLTGLGLLMGPGLKGAPIGWHVMTGAGTLMFLVFGHLYFGPFRRLQIAARAADWPEGGRRMAQIGTLVTLNFVLGWVAIAAVLLLK
jgi:uncharacterized membrane protein